MKQLFFSRKKLQTQKHALQSLQFKLSFFNGVQADCISFRQKKQDIQLSHVPRPSKPSFSDSDKVNIPDVVAYVAVPDHVWVECEWMKYDIYNLYNMNKLECWSVSCICALCGPSSAALCWNVGESQPTKVFFASIGCMSRSRTKTAKYKFMF